MSDGRSRPVPSSTGTLCSMPPREFLEPGTARYRSHDVAGLGQEAEHLDHMYTPFAKPFRRSQMVNGVAQAGL
jgi:hypothetical protein